MLARLLQIRTVARAVERDFSLLAAALRADSPVNGGAKPLFFPDLTNGATHEINSPLSLCHRFRKDEMLGFGGRECLACIPHSEQTAHRLTIDAYAQSAGYAFRTGSGRFRKPLGWRLRRGSSRKMGMVSASFRTLVQKNRVKCGQNAIFPQDPWYKMALIATNMLFH
jgi:hypothetical protein